MTHFVGLVIGPDVDGQLARYDEGLEVPPWKDYEDPPKRDGRGLSWPWCVAEEAGVDIDDLHAVAAYLNERWGDEMPYEVDADGLYCRSTRNHEGFWDWFVIGGRWDDYMLLRDGSYVSAAPASDVDWPAMLATHGFRASVVVAEGVWRSGKQWHMFGVSSPTPEGDSWDEWFDRFTAGLGDLTVTVVDFHT